MIRKGHHNGSSYWYCKTCNRYSSGRKKPSQEAIFNRYSQGTFTIKELSQEFNISASTVKRILRNYTVTKVAHTPGKVVVQMDTTYWGRNFGLVIFMDAATHLILHHFFIRGKERIEDYKQGLAYLEHLGWEVAGVVADGLSGLKKQPYTNSLSVLSISSSLTHSPTSNFETSYARCPRITANRLTINAEQPL